MARSSCPTPGTKIYRDRGLSEARLVLCTESEDSRRRTARGTLATMQRTMSSWLNPGSESSQHRECHPTPRVFGPESGELLVLSWGGTYGACHTAVAEAINDGQSVAHCHLRHLNPFPANLGEILERYESVLVPELNTGQLRMLIRATVPN